MKKLLHNFCYWTNPFYMIATDIRKNPKAVAFIDEHFGHILKHIINKLANFLQRFELINRRTIKIYYGIKYYYLGDTNDNKKYKPKTKNEDGQYIEIL